MRLPTTSSHCRFASSFNGLPNVNPSLNLSSNINAVKKMLDKHSARLLPVTETITLRATELMQSLTLSHGLQMGDALIAATALEHQVPVLTANVKHFGTLAELKVNAFLP
jgi:predicted nucleic acid-binding protein